jgi:hypothetical protein
VRVVWLGCVTAALLGGCNLIFGVSDYGVDATGGSASGGSGGIGGGTVCLPAEVQNCYEGPPGTEQHGACMQGTQVCLDDGSAFGPCEGQVLPEPDDCSTDADEDCNGLACGEVIWSRPIGDAPGHMTDQTVTAIAPAGGGAVAVGTFSETLRIGATGLPTSTLVDGFVAKFDEQGAVEWVTAIGGAEAQVPTAVAVDENGYIYVAGYTTGTLEIGGSSDEAVGEDAFVAKLDPTGTDVEWMHLFGGASDDRAGALALGEGGLLYVGGQFRGTVTFGPDTLDTAGADLFATALDGDSGDARWGAQIGGMVQAQVLDLAAGPGGVAVAASFSGDTNVGGDDLSSPNDDGLVLVYSDEGALLHHLDLPGMGDSAATEVAFAGPEIVVAGTFTSDLDLRGAMLAGNGTVDSFVAAYDGTLATLTWHRALSGAGAQRIEGMAVTPALEVILVGSFTSGLDIGTGDLQAQGAADLFLAKLLPGGEPRFATAFGDVANQIAFSVEAMPRGDALVGGLFEGELDLTGAPHFAQAVDGIVVRFGP